MQVMLFDYYRGVKVDPSNLWVDMMYSIVEFKMMVSEKLLRVLSPRVFCHSSITRFYNATINTFDFVQKGQSFVCVVRTVE